LIDGIQEYEHSCSQAAAFFSKAEEESRLGHTNAALENYNVAIHICKLLCASEINIKETLCQTFEMVSKTFLPSLVESCLLYLNQD